MATEHEILGELLSGRRPHGPVRAVAGESAGRPRLRQRSQLREELEADVRGSGHGPSGSQLFIDHNVAGAPVYRPGETHARSALRRAGSLARRRGARREPAWIAGPRERRAPIAARPAPASGRRGPGSRASGQSWATTTSASRPSWRAGASEHPEAGGAQLRRARRVRLVVSRCVTTALDLAPARRPPGERPADQGRHRARCRADALAPPRDAAPGPDGRRGHQGRAARRRGRPHRPSGIVDRDGAPDGFDVHPQQPGQVERRSST